jgi:ABC-type lipoprotein release transport system permease subunit
VRSTDALWFESRLALRFLGDHRLQTLLIITGIAVGAAVIVFITALITGLQANIIERTLGAQSHIRFLPPDEVNLRVPLPAGSAALVLESGQEPEVLQAGARRLAMTLARALQLTLLCEHAQWMIDHGGDRRGYAAAMRFARQPVDLMTEVDPEADRLLLG